VATDDWRLVASIAHDAVFLAGGRIAEVGTSRDLFGHPALDFLNTVADTGKTRDEDKLVDWPAVRAWAEKAALLAPDDLARLLHHPRRDGPDELAALHRFRDDAFAAADGCFAWRPDARAASREGGGVPGAVKRAPLRWLRRARAAREGH